MLLNLFLIFLGIAIILTIIGFAFDSSLFLIVGTCMLFMLGLMMLTNPLEYKVGETSNLNYGTNFSNNWEAGDLINETSTPYLLKTNTTAIYQTYDDSSTNRFGFLIMAMGVLAFCLALFDIR